MRVKNAGTGRMPVEVAAARGDRFTKNKPNPLYRDARQTVTLGAGEERTVEIPCAFQPERVLVDPDVKVLQLRRKAAVVKIVETPAVRGYRRGLCSFSWPYRAPG